MTKVIAISNQKGGVGKTTQCVNIGARLAGLGHRVLLIDNDPQGNLTLSCLGDDLPVGVVESSGGYSEAGPVNVMSLYKGVLPDPVDLGDNRPDLIPASKHLSTFSGLDILDIGYKFKDTVESIKGYDFILIDCLPSFGVLQTVAQLCADYVLIPTHLEEFSVSGIEEQLRSTANIKRMNPKLELLGVVCNEVSAQKVLVEEHFLDEIKKSYPNSLLSSMITRSAKLKESHALRQSIFDYLPYSDQARQYVKLVDELLEKLNHG